MKVKQWPVLSKKGIVCARKTKPTLDWNQIAMRIELNVPDELFNRPHIEAKLTIKDVPPNVFDPEVIVNTKELIEQQTGAKIDFKVIQEDKVLGL